jgi:hypothetical protein
MRTLVGVAGVESPGWRNPYAAIGPVTVHGTRAYGKYQIMENNIPTWTKQYLKVEMTVQEFMDSPLAQEKLAGIIFTERIGTHENFHDPISIWFSGRKEEGNVASDGHMTVPEYIKQALAI